MVGKLCADERSADSLLGAAGWQEGAKVGVTQEFTQRDEVEIRVMEEDVAVYLNRKVTREMRELVISIREDIKMARQALRELREAVEQSREAIHESKTVAEACDILLGLACSPLDRAVGGGGMEDNQSTDGSSNP